MSCSRIKIKNYSFLYVLVLFAIVSSTLRVTNNGMTSFYRMLSPFAVLLILITNIKRYKTEMIFLVSAMVYSLLVSIIFFDNIELDQIIFTIYVFFLYLIIKEISYKDRNFEKNFWRFINVVTTLTIIAAWLQHFVYYVLPYLNPPMKYGAMSVYFTNENELGAALSSVFVIYLYILLFTKKKLNLVMKFNAISIPVIVFMNDAKLSMIGIVAACFLYSLYYFRKEKTFSKIGDKTYIYLIVAISSITLLGIFIINPTIHTRDYDMSIRDMIFNNIIAIITSQELEGNGTYRERSSAIIYGFRELKKSFGFGIGIGNTVDMFSRPEYYLRYAKSMHNIMLQFLVELGYFAVVVYIAIWKKVRKLFLSVRVERANMLKAVFFISLIFISAQSSVGFLSNYLELVVIMYICLIDLKKFNELFA